MLTEKTLGKVVEQAKLIVKKIETVVDGGSNWERARGKFLVNYKVLHLDKALNHTGVCVCEKHLTILATYSEMHPKKIKGIND